MSRHSPLLKLLSLGLSLTIIVVWPQVALANPTSSNYVLDGYAMGSSSDTSMGSSSFKLFGTTGQNDALSGSSTNYTFNGGLLYGLQSSTPHQPSLTNDKSYYDRLLIVLNAADDDDALQYAVAISDDSFVTVNYVTNLGTLKSTLTDADFYSYDDWGGTSGTIISGLKSNATYKVRVASHQGGYDQSEFGPEASASTELPTLTFTVDGNVNMGLWNENNNYSSTAVSTLTTSTNAYNGYSVYAYATQPLTRQNGSETIANYAGTYASPGSWLSGQGFGYTTNDTLVGGATKWNAATCPADGGPPLCYAAFSQTAPGDVVVDHSDPLTTGPLTDQEFELTYKVVTQASQTAGTYNTSIIYTIVPVY